MLALTASANRTAIVVVFSGDQIIIASDGVVTKIKNGVKTFPQFCKVRREGRFFYGISGDYGVPGTDYDVWKIAMESITRSKDIMGIYDAVKSAILPKVESIAARNEVGDAEDYSRWINGEPVIEMVFAGARP